MSCLLLLLISNGFARQIHHIEFKAKNNQQLVTNANIMEDMMKIISQYKCLKTGNIDILIPITFNNQFHPRQNDVIPARIALNNVATNTWQLPDYFIVNKEVYNTSPLLDFIIKDNLYKYAKVKSIQSLDLYILNEKKCYEKK